MTRTFVVRSLAAASCAMLTLIAAGAAPGSEYSHPSAVSTNPADWTPEIVVTAGVPKPIAYSIAEAGSQMVVGGRFDRVGTNPGTNEFPRSSVFAFNATTGAIHTGFDPQVDGDVWSVLADGSSVYIGGNFRNVEGQPRAALAKLDLATGALDPNFVPTFTGGRVSDMEMHGEGADKRLIVSGTFSKRLVALNVTTGKPTTYISNVVGGKLPNSDAAQVFKFDISPGGAHLVAVGNFTTVDNEPRPRVFMLDLGAPGPTGVGASLSSWNYEPLGEPCSSTRLNAIAYVQDVDFSPDGSYFALAALGFMYQGFDSSFSSSRRWFQICDSVSRFETGNLNPTQPTWINYTGGDSLKSVAVTGSAIYVQGHSRWLDNPYGRDFKTDQAVDRMGGGAIDPNGVGTARFGDFAARPGKALPWNPGMPQASGGYQILPTAAGVWFVTDGLRFGGEVHRGIRFAPLP